MFITGKSFLLKEIIKQLKVSYRKEEIAVTASTGIAACNINGTTLHSFAGIGLGEGTHEMLMKRIRQNKRTADRWATVKVLIIDESWFLYCV